MANARSDASHLNAIRRAVATRFLPALGYRDYRILWFASLLGGAAASGLIVARGWMVFTLSDSSMLVGVTTFAAMIPLLVVPPFVGLMADKLDRRTLLAGTFALNLGHNLLLAILALTGTMQVWHLVALSLVNGIARAALMPTMQALVPNLVPRGLILNAVALNSATIHGSKLVGPGIVALLLTVAGPGSAFLACTAFYALGLVQVLRIRTASTGRLDPAKSALHNLLAGLDPRLQRPCAARAVGHSRAALRPHHVVRGRTPGPLPPAARGRRVRLRVVDDGGWRWRSRERARPGRSIQSAGTRTTAAVDRLCQQPDAPRVSSRPHAAAGTARGRRYRGIAVGIHGNHDGDDAIAGAGCHSGPRDEHLCFPRGRGDGPRQSPQRHTWPTRSAARWCCPSVAPPSCS